jgi:hypothetical protein
VRGGGETGEGDDGRWLGQDKSGRGGNLRQQLLELGHASTCVSAGGEAVWGSGSGHRSK